jgi:hypothetical protein
LCPAFTINCFHLTHFARAPITAGFLGTAALRGLKCAFIVYLQLGVVAAYQTIKCECTKAEHGRVVGLKMHVRTVIYDDGTLHARICLGDRNLFSAWPWCSTALPGDAKMSPDVCAREQNFVCALIIGAMQPLSLFGCAADYTPPFSTHPPCRRSAARAAPPIFNARLFSAAPCIFFHASFFLLPPPD